MQFHFVLLVGLQRKLRNVGITMLAGISMLILVGAGCVSAMAQSEPNLEVGFKPYGSYHGSDIDSVNVMNGNVVHHIPLPMQYPQRGGHLNNSFLEVNNSKNWAVQFDQATSIFYWTSNASWGQGMTGVPTLWPRISRMVVTGHGTSVASNYAVTTWDGASHPVSDVSGNATGFAAMDGTGWHVTMSNPGSNKVFQNALLVDREGNQFAVSQITGPCSTVSNPNFPADGPFGPIIKAGGLITECNQSGWPTSATDSNGNMYAVNLSPTPGNPNQLQPDTLGRVLLPVGASASGTITSDPSGCVSSLSFATAIVLPYTGYNGASNQIKTCFGALNLATNFGASVPGPNGVAEPIVEFPNPRAPAPGPTQVPVTIILPDGSDWTFSYDSYGNITNLGLPLGGSISYQFATLAFPTLSEGAAPVSRAVTQRLLTDNNGNTYKWKYQWMTQTVAGSNGLITSYTNVVTDPEGNDTAHVFSIVGAGYYETSALLYQGSSGSGVLLKRTDTTYQVFPASTDTDGANQAVLPISVQTTVYPSGKITLVEKSYDSALAIRKGSGNTTYGVLLTEKDHDWGPGAPGPVLRETDHAYEWQTKSNYLSANMLDVPSSLVVKDGSGTRMAETDYTHDEAGYLTSYTGTLPQGTHGAAPASVRGNLTTVSKWLNTSSSPVVSHTNWFDTGEVYQQIDPRGNATTHSYDSAYAGAYGTKTCNALSQCVSGTYDFNTGLLTSFTDANASYQASGNTQGDPNHTSNYNYDFLSRMTLAQRPPDASGNRPQATFTYSAANSFPFNVQMQKSITISLNDLSTTYFDGLGRAYETQHATPNGNATVQTTYDGLDHVVQVTNPYYSTSDPTYGAIKTQYDALGRPTQVTKQDGSITTAQYDQTAALTSNSTCTLSNDEAGNQRKGCVDGMGRLIEVDEPGGESPAISASGSFTINGTLQSWSATRTATSGHIELTFSGALQSKASCSPSGQACSDSGLITITVNTPSGAFSKSAAYSSATGTDSGQTVRALATAFHADSTSPVDAIYYGADEFGNIVTDLVARATGSATNYPVTISIVSNDPTDFSPASFQASGGSSLIDGQDAATASTGGHAYLSFSGSLQSNASCSASSGQACTDSGSISTTVTTASGAFTKSVSYSSATGSDSGQAVQLLANAFHADNASPVDAFFSTDESGNYVLYLTARTTGSGTNYPLSTSIVSNDPTDFPSPSFQVSEGSSLVGGQNGTAGSTVYDSGTVYVSVGPFVASTAYSQSGNNTAALVASALVSGPTGLNQSSSPVAATVSGSTITLIYKVPGSAGNLPVDLNSSSANPDNPSFTSPGSILSGGSDAQNGTIATPYVTLYHYDALNNLQCVHQKGADASADRSCSDAAVPSAWRPRSFSYDSLSRLLSATNPESGPITYSYDANGNLLQKTSLAPNQTGSAKQTISYCYDALNRVTGKAYSAQSCPLTSPVVTYSYDAGTNGIGHLTSLTDQAGSGSYGYDALGRVVNENRTIVGVQKSLAYSYNLNSSVATLTYPSGAVLTYTPDSAGRMLSAVDTSNNINYVESATYDATSSLTGFVSGQSSSFVGIANSFSYNNRLQPVTISAASPGATVFSIGYDFHFGNGDNGNVFAITNYRDTSRNQSFTYDALNRLTSAQNAGTDCTKKAVNGGTEYWGNSYGYDPWGNLLQKTPTKCSAENLSVPVLTNNQLVGYGYDAAGNMTRDSTTGNNYSYDQENRITGAAGYTYTYDADGNRVEKSNGYTGTIYWNMTSGIVAESDLNGNLQHEYMFFNGKRVARKDLPSASVFYYFSDEIDSASVITDSSGVIKSESDYYPWGGEAQITNNDNNDYKFTGKKRDRETGLDYFGARYYGNWLGRFLTADPLLNSGRSGTPQTWNRYTYVLNNPLSILDPTGLYNLVDHCSDGDKKCEKQFNDSAEKLRKGLDRLQKAVDDLPAGDEKTRLQNSLNALGTEGDDNNVFVSFGTTQGGGSGETTGQNNPTTNEVTFGVTLDPKKLGTDTDFAIAGAHEGTHVDDLQNGLKSSNLPALSLFSVEYRGYQTSSYVSQALGVGTLKVDGNLLWNSSWKAADLQTLRDKNITKTVIGLDKPGHADHQETTPHNPWPN